MACCDKMMSLCTCTVEGTFALVGDSPHWGCRWDTVAGWVPNWQWSSCSIGEVAGATTYSQDSPVKVLLECSVAGQVLDQPWSASAAIPAREVLSCLCPLSISHQCYESPDVTYALYLWQLLSADTAVPSGLWCASWRGTVMEVSCDRSWPEILESDFWPNYTLN